MAPDGQVTQLAGAAFNGTHRNSAREPEDIVPGEARKPKFKDPVPSPVLPGYETLDAGNSTGYAATTSIQHDPETGGAFGVATNTGATRCPWGIARFEEDIEHRTSDVNPA